MKSNFEQWILKEKYAKIRGLGDRLVFMKELINWKPFIPIVRSVFMDNSTTGGRPHTDELVVVRSMLLQSWYGLSDEELEFHCNDRLSFQNFLGYPDKIPDFTTIWKIRERLVEAGKDKLIWKELQRQLDKKGYVTKKGVIQDATFIVADQGRKRVQNEKRAKKEGKEIEYTDKQKSHMDKDGTYAVKSGNVHYGYKDHIKIDVEHGLIRSIETTTVARFIRLDPIACSQLSCHPGKRLAGVVHCAEHFLIFLEVNNRGVKRHRHCHHQHCCNRQSNQSFDQSKTMFFIYTFHISPRLIIHHLIICSYPAC